MTEKVKSVMAKLYRQETDLSVDQLPYTKEFDNLYGKFRSATVLAKADKPSQSRVTAEKAASVKRYICIGGLRTFNSEDNESIENYSKTGRVVMVWSLCFYVADYIGVKV
jgi:hypothetical protein